MDEAPCLIHFCRSSFSTSGRFSFLSQLSKDRFSPVLMWISTKHGTSHQMTISSHRFNEKEFSIDTYLYSPSGMLSSYDFRILPGSVCFSMSSVHGDGLSIFEISSQSIFSVIARDTFGNIRTEAPQSTLVSIIYDSSSKSHVTTSTFQTLFSEVSLTVNLNVASGFCNHLIGALVGILRFKTNNTIYMFLGIVFALTVVFDFE